MGLGLRYPYPNPNPDPNPNLGTEHAAHGFYVLRFFQEDPRSDDDWKVVLVDDRLPCGADGKPCFGHNPSEGVLWAAIVEKALAKLLGSYEATCHPNPNPTPTPHPNPDPSPHPKLNPTTTPIPNPDPNPSQDETVISDKLGFNEWVRVCDRQDLVGQWEVKQLSEITGDSSVSGTIQARARVRGRVRGRVRVRVSVGHSLTLP